MLGLRSFVIALVSLAGCVSTELETPSNHPAQPDAPSSPRPQSRAALDPRFDPFSAGEAKERASEPTPRAGSWTCSMHPEIRRDQPGNCPICGMKLVPVKP